jgi:hypothetical protein
MQEVQIQMHEIQKLIKRKKIWNSFAALLGFLTLAFSEVIR